MVVLAVMVGAAALAAVEDHDGDAGDDNDVDTEQLLSSGRITAIHQIQEEQ